MVIDQVTLIQSVAYAPWYTVARKLREPLKLHNKLRFLLGGLKMARLKIDRTMLDLQVKIRDCWVLVGPYPSCT
jgi:hypothetical protein